MRTEMGMIVCTKEQIAYAIIFSYDAAKTAHEISILLDLTPEQRVLTIQESQVPWIGHHIHAILEKLRIFLSGTLKCNISSIRLRKCALVQARNHSKRNYCILLTILLIGLITGIIVSSVFAIYINNYLGDISCRACQPDILCHHFFCRDKIH